jgi:hypothetical protein
MRQMMKEDEADRALISAWGLIVAAQVPISVVTRCDGCEPMGRTGER